MSDEPTTSDLVERVRIILEASDRADFDTVLEFYADDAVWVTSDGIGTFEGVDAMRAHWEDWYRNYDDFRLEASKIADLGNGVVLAVVRQGGRLAGSAAALTEDLALVMEWSNTRIVRVTTYFDLEAARVAAERLAKERGLAV
jgi:ketosteroid isomerase-like protein